MSTRHYSHTIGGQGVATGLPVRRGSYLYEHDPEARYPDLLDLGVHPSQHQFTERPYSVLPHLPVTFIKEPELMNPDRPGTGNVTRRRYFVVKLGQPVMAAQNRDRSIGVFIDDGGTAQVNDKTYVDEEKLADNGTPVGFKNDGTYQLKDTNDAGSDPELVIDTETYDNLDASTAGSPSQDDYKEVTAEEPVSIDRFQALPDEKKEGFRMVYEDVEDTNDEIATGGVDMYASTEKALFGSSERVEHVRVDADEFYFGNATKRAGFVYPSTGGADRTLFYNQIDAQANGGVTLPTDGSGSDRTATDIGSVTDVSAGNVSAFADSAAHLEAKPTIGVSHADLPQVTSHKYHHFSTGTGAVQPARTGELLLPFINIAKLESVITNRTDLTWGGSPSASDSFNFVDQTEARSGIKTGLYGVSDISDVNKISLLTERDDGYSNLYYNLAAPFLLTDKIPSLQDEVKPDLFGNYTLAQNGALSQDTSTGAWNFSDSQAADNHNGNVGMGDLGLSSHVIGAVSEVYSSIDQGRVDMTQLRVNPIFQNRIANGDAARNLTNEGYKRPGGTADTGGLDQLVADTTFMALGGANESWLTSLLPEFDGLGQDVGQILQDLVTAGAVGEVKVIFDTTGIR